MASRAFESDTPEIPKADFGKTSGLKPQIVGMTAAFFYTEDEVVPVTTGNARTKGMNFQW